MSQRSALNDNVDEAAARQIHVGRDGPRRAGNGALLRLGRGDVRGPLGGLFDDSLVLSRGRASRLLCRVVVRGRRLVLRLQKRLGRSPVRDGVNHRKDS